MSKTKKAIGKLCDQLRSKLIKILAGFRCEYCGKRDHLNSHHIFSRNNYATRYDLENGVCLCSGCHTLSSKFSAHKTPLEFAEWIISVRGKERYYRLKRKSKGVWDGDYDKVQKYLLEETEKLTN